MILPHQLICAIANSNATATMVKCGLPPADYNHALTWSAISAVATVVLAVFAFAAWKISRTQLSESRDAQRLEMKKLEDEVDRSARRAEEEQLHHEADRQVEALVPYQSLWNAVRSRIEAGRWTPEVPMASDLLSAGMAFRLRHHRNYEQLDNHLRPLEEHLVDKVRGRLIEPRPHTKLPNPPELIQHVISDYLSSVTAYQLDPARRAEIAENWDHQLEELKSGEYVNMLNAKLNG